MSGRGVLLLRTGGRNVGLPLASVVEVGEASPVQPVPGSAPSVRGIIEARGRLMPVAHLGALLGGGPCPPPAQDRIQVLARLGERWLALEVDAVDAAPNEEILPPPEGSGVAAWALGVVRRDRGWIPILNLGALAERLREAKAATS
jgi:purine-binding chemotaxis protein CheW